MYIYIYMYNVNVINLEVPIVYLLNKTDLLDKSAKKQLEKFLEPDSYLLE
jgi:hypothetical protein